jgi:hypothetical protein
MKHEDITKIEKELAEKYNCDKVSIINIVHLNR